MASVAENPLEAGFLRWMGDFLVALTANVATTNDEGVAEDHDFLWYSGFLINVQGQTFWVTAGHCIELFETELKKPGRKVYGTSFMDCFGTKPKHPATLPFHYDIGDAVRLHTKNPDFDFAIVPLGDFICRGLATNGVKVVTREMWHDRPERDYFEYKVFGLPAHGVERISEQPSWGLRPVAVGVDRLDPDDVPGCPYDDWFVGHLRPELDRFLSPVGMSGGPIFAFYMDEKGDRRCDIVAVQSSWFENSRIIFGCPLSSFAEVLHQAVETAKVQSSKNCQA